METLASDGINQLNGNIEYFDDGTESNTLVYES